MMFISSILAQRWLFQMQLSVLCQISTTIASVKSFSLVIQTVMELHLLTFNMPLSVYSHDVDWISLAEWSQPESKTLDVADSFALYDICKFSAACAHSFFDTNWIAVSSRAQRRGPQVVRAMVHEVLDTSIVIDSGSDATVVPLAFESCDLPIQERGSIQDCQGNKIPKAGMREFHLVLRDVNGKNVVLKDYGFLSQHVSGPLMSYGHLFRNGWDICRQDDGGLF